MDQFDGFDPHGNGMPDPAELERRIEMLKTFEKKMRKNTRQQVHRYADDVAAALPAEQRKEAMKCAGEGLLRAYVYTGLAYGMSDQLVRMVGYYFGDFVKGITDTKKLSDYVNAHDLDHAPFAGEYPEETDLVLNPKDRESAAGILARARDIYRDVTLQATLDLSIRDDDLPQDEEHRNAADARSSAVDALFEKAGKRFAPPAKMVPMRGGKKA
jgi:hypothetical protein